MIKPINAKLLATLLGVSDRQARNIIVSGAYKSQPLQVRQEKSLRGKPSYLVLWDTELNQPAQPTGEENDVERICRRAINNFEKTAESCDKTDGKENLSGAYPALHAAKSFERLTELNQPATGDNHESIRATNAENSSAHQQRTRANQTPAPTVALPTRAVGTIAMQRGMDNKSENFGAFDGNSKRLLNQPTTGESHEKTNSDSVQTAAPDSIAAPTAALSFKQLAQRAEKNAQARDNQRRDAFLDKIFGDSNVVSIQAADNSISDLPATAYATQTPTPFNSERHPVLATEPPIYKSAENPSLVSEAQTAAVDSQNLAIDPETGEILSVETQSTAPEFKNVLDKFLAQKMADFYAENPNPTAVELKKRKASNAVLKNKYESHFKTTGEIHEKLLGNETRGVRCSLPPEIRRRFVEMINNSVNPKHKGFKEKSVRKVTEFKFLLDIEFNTNVSYDVLCYLVNSNRDLKRKLIITDEDLINGMKGEATFKKAPSYFTPLPAGDLFFMDGVISRRSINGEDGKPFYPVFISIQDFGSRKRMVGRFYKSESMAASIDIFIRFLLSTPFVAKKLRFRPDNAKGFLNLERLFEDINNKNLFLDVIKNLHEISNITVSSFLIEACFARAQMPTDKSPIETLHRNHHAADFQIDAIFSNKVELPTIGTRKVGNNMEQVFKKHIDISLEELNDVIDERTGLTVPQMLLNRINKKEGRFTSGGKKNQKWVPDEKWQELLDANANNLVKFTAPMLEPLRIYGYPKVKRTIQGVNGKQGGVITYNNISYYTEDDTLKGLEVDVSAINDTQLVIFEREKGGVRIGMATKFAETEKSAKLVNKEKATVIKRENKGLVANILKALTDASINYKKSELDELIVLGLTVEVTKDILQEQKQRYATTPENVRFSLFKKDVKNGLETSNNMLQALQKRERFEVINPEEK